jgi:enamine deaminase RidA (YjgF/YER057c/UK114 family)
VKRFLVAIVTVSTVAVWLLAVPQGRSMPPQQAAASGSSVQYVQGTARQQNDRAYSPAVISNGGKIVWLAGHSALVDSSGKSLAGDFDAQAKEVFAQIDRTLKRAGGSLQNVVTWTVYINDSRYGDRLVSIRKAMFPDGKFPGSALITVSNFDTPGVLVEIQGIAVIADRRM